MNYRLRSFLLFCFLAIASSALVLGQSSPASLATGKPISLPLKGGEKHVYLFECPGNQFSYIVAEQDGIDLVLTLLSPDGVKIAEIDGPNGSRGPEKLWFVSDRPGTYSIEVTSLDAGADPGKYELKVNESRDATPDLKHFADAEALVRAGMSIYDGKGADKGEAAAQKVADASLHIELIQDEKEKKALGFMDIGRAYATLHIAVSSLENYDRAAAIYAELGLKREQVATLIQSAGQALNQIDFINRNEKIRKLAVELNDRKIESSSLIQIGTGYYNLGDFSQAISVVQQALTIASELGDKRRMEKSYDNLGAMFTAQGNFAAALESHQKAIEIQITIGKKEPKPDTILNVGNVYEGLGNLELAIENFQKALTAFEKMRGSEVGIAYAISNIGSVYLKMGQYDRAMEYFLRAQPLKAKFLPDDPTSYYNIASVYLGTGRKAESLEYLQQAIAMCKKIGDADCITRSEIQTSDTYFSLQNYPKALEFANEAIAVSKQNDYPNQLWSAQLSAANAQLALGKTDEALRSLDDSIATIDQLRENLTGDEEIDRRFFESKSDPFRMIIGLSVGRGQFDKAFSYAERIKARTILDVLEWGKVDVSKAMTTVERSTEQSLTNELASLNSELSDEENVPRKLLIKDRLNKKRLALDDFRIRLYSSHPELRMQRGELRPVTPAETAGLLTDTDSALLEYVVSGPKSYLFVITKNAADKVNLNAYRIDIDQCDLASKVEAYRSKVASGDLDFQRSSRELYDLLLKPAQAHLAGKTNITIVPDGPLWNLPFQTLKDDKDRYLIQQLAVSYAPSLTALREMTRKAKNRNSTARPELIAFGEPVISEEASRRVKQAFMSEQLEPLAESGRLVAELGKMYGPGRSKIYVGSQASEEIAKNESPKYRIVQFATHGILNDISPMYSHLVLAQNSKDPNQDGLLEAWEMKNLDLSADMVILSACDTARGKISSGEGVIGMTWAMFIAGTPTTVASQWKVESSSTTELMLEFHRQLLAGKVSKAEALRRASLKLLKTERYKHPVYWAGFVLVGDGS